MNILRQHGLQFKLDSKFFFDSAQNIYLTLRRTWSDHDFSFLCDTDKDRVTIYVDPMGITVINEGYFKWMELLLRGEAAETGAPCFVSVPAKNLFEAVCKALHDHKFIRPGEHKPSILGPFFDRSKIGSYVEIAARNAGISLESVKRFREEYPEELRYGMERYFDTTDLGVPEW